eukprot:TRINITY_DN17027_c0_g1_i1.p1 TRINITY_DN17027_c0_g1~~TRINITY_DN17027_c0_g1_i1.p1  ORF type:complete len:618 (-),score=138.72 TRINITY_DN17027_c0_g1_i1:795-2648(-)
MDARGYVSVEVPNGKYPDSPIRSNNIWRKWNKLSRLQKSTIYLLVTILIFIFIFTHQQEKRVHYNNKDDHRAVRGSGTGHRWPPQFQKNLQDSEPAAGLDETRLAADNEEKNAAEEEGKDDDGGDVGDDEYEDGGNGSNQAKEEDVDSNSSKYKLTGEPKLSFKGPQNERQRAVASAFKHAWQNYRKYAWGRDHLKPISKTYQTWFDLGLTLIDSLDTMLVMGLNDEFQEARDWVQQNLQFTTNKDVNLFETTIRVLGGLLSAYHLSGDKVFLDKATELGDRMMGAFDSVSGIPFSDVNLMSRSAHAPKWSPDSSTSEVTTIQLEFRDLSRLTGNSKYENAVSRVSELIHNLEKDTGLVPIFINANTGKFRSHSTITMGARGDSYYEYLLKQWLQTGKTVDYLEKDYVLAMSGVMTKLAKRTQPNNLLFIGEILAGGKEFKPKMDELACFLPGTMALGYKNGMPESHLDFAQEVAYTCFLTFARQPTFLAPEISYFNTAKGSTKDFYCKPNDSHYLLRPETIESLWYLYYITGNTTYQDWGWQIFQGIEKYTRVSGGYTTISNVRNPIDTRPKDMMESFFLGETLKYLYLLFADEHEIDLDKWLLNTEAHLLPMYDN